MPRRPGEDQTDLNHAESDRAQYRADDAAVAAGKQRAADHGHGDRLQFDAFAAQRVHGREARHLDDAGDRAASAEVSMNRMIVHAIDRHAQIARGLLVLPARLHPIAETGPRQQKRAERRR